MTEQFVPSPEYMARNQRFMDVIQLKQPDRIPIFMGVGHILADLGGVTQQEIYENPAKAQEILERFTLDYDPDCALLGLLGSPEISRILGDRMTKWPGYGLGPDGTFQFDEHEFMKAADYDAFLNDPSGFAIRTYLPRAFKELEGLALLPPLGMSLFGFYNINNLAALSAPPVAAALQAINKATQAVLATGAQAMASMGRMAALGYPFPVFLAGSLVEAPFDFMSDTLRGMRGIFLDMMRQPDKLLAAQEKVLEFELEFAINQAKVTHLPYAAIPLHRGSDGFMSLPQFEKFYRPQLKELIVRLADEGITSMVIFEGIWDQRLEYLTELPKGKVVGWFQDSDIFKVKEAVGDIMCIMGGMPNTMLVGGTVEQVRERTKKVCEVVGKDGGFLMSTGIPDLIGCKPQLIKAWVDATKEFGTY